MAVHGGGKCSLLQKYDIPIDHLSYEYVEKCNDAKELERIVKILRSGEEGSYPDLLKSFEDKLEKVMPGSRLLKVSQPLLSTKDNGYEFYMQTINEIKELRKEADCYREDVKNKPRKNTLEDLPAVRSPGKITFSQHEAKGDEPKKVKTEPVKVKSAVPRKYEDWEKYDVDRELLRMDLDEERARERIRKLKHKVQRKKEEEMKKVSIADGGGDYEYTKAEKVFMASQQKERGNEYYKAGDNWQAIEHYNAAIMLDPTPIAYNNRAMAYLNLNKFEEAINDCNKVLEVEPDNLKALMRRGVAYQKQNNYQKALEDFTRVTILQPHNHRAHNLAREMQEKLGGFKKVVRMKIEDGSPVKRTYKSLFKHWESRGIRNAEYNEFGLPKSICNCSGMPLWVRNPPSQYLPGNSSDDECPPSCEQVSESMETSETEECSSSSVCSRLRESVECAKPDNNIIFTHGDFEPEDGSSGNQTYKTLFKLWKSHGIRNAEHNDVDSKEKTEDSGSDVVNFSEVIEPFTVDDDEFNNLLPDLEDPLKVGPVGNWDDEEPMQEAEGIEDLSLEEESSLGSITSAYEFTNAWQTMKNRSDPVELAPLLRSINPADLHTLVGKNMDGPMLSMMLHCLEAAFMHEPDFVLNFLQSIARVDRFDLILYFLNQEDRAVLLRIFKGLENAGRYPPQDLQNAFFR